MKKAEALTHWRTLKAGQPILPHMTPIPYKSEGSKYGACGIRIDGNPAFVDAVLSRLQDLMDGENHVTRLELARRGVVGDFKATPNADQNGEVCYVRLHVRGREGMMTSAIFGRELDAATDRWAASNG